MDAAVKFIVENFAVIPNKESDQFTFDLVSEFIQHWEEDLSHKTVSSDREVIYHLVVDDWLMKNVANRRQYMAAILTNIDLRCLPRSFLQETMEGRDIHLFDMDGVCAALVLRAKTRNSSSL